MTGLDGGADFGTTAGASLLTTRPRLVARSATATARLFAGGTMRPALLRSLALTGFLALAPLPGDAQTAPPAASPAAPPAAPPPFATTKVTDNVYIFRMMGHQAMFVVTPDGVIATDPVGFVNKKGGEIFLAEIRKVTSAPVRYVVYSHHHYDHIAGGQPFKQAGATFIAQGTRIATWQR
jgi:hypothetical protein